MGRGDFNSRGGGRGAPRGGSFGRGGGRGGRPQQPQGPPAKVEPFATFSHVCGNQIIVKALGKELVPRFFRSVYFENKQPIGKVDEIFGPIENYLFSVNLEEGIAPKSFKQDQLIYMDAYDCMPMDRFLPRPKGAPGISRGGSRGGGRGGPRGGGFSRGGRGGAPRGGGFSRGGPRGGGFSRGGGQQRGGYDRGGYGRGGFKR
ncbi:unnamed protein product (macronuclear) [Paramecium tetraurelia]|uniref:H/ACA ribonucleoprotein complex subunit n=1 Tax=Paramecium tetraurelia TaxID=5888 RepID=A0E5T7_PARTE|nr:uncharacterized protein GSPATT00003516001 [Paramecium tetraurelia]CAK90654.1 unnamed protein product [Paramecium tetraurelia]|eukprot:XP_001458051.1 hypothetical protein (macronuclear) [Paramecium tetraurelia strain d4-2]